jgi:hypothetical protein
MAVFTPAVSSLLTQQKLTQMMVTQQVAKSVVITFATGTTLTLQNATITQSMANAGGGGTVQITYQGGTTAPTGPTASDDWTTTT